MNTSIRTITASLALAFAMLCGGSALAASAPIPATEIGASEADDARFDAAVSLEGQININSASAAELELLPGIGPSIAKRIVDYRAKHTFKQRNNIMRIKGIGQKTFAKIKDYLIVEGDTTLRIAK